MFYNSFSFQPKFQIYFLIYQNSVGLSGTICPFLRRQNMKLLKGSVIEAVKRKTILIDIVELEKETSKINKLRCVLKVFPSLN